MGQNKPKHPLAALLIPPAFWLGGWQLAAFLIDGHVNGQGNELLLPYPASVLSALAELLPTLEFWSSVGSTLLRVAGGLAFGVLLGAGLAGVSCSCIWLDRLFSPVIRAIRATPVASFILLVLLWTGRNTVPAVVAALMVLPVMWENLARGIQSTDPKLLELARAYRFSRSKTLYLIYLPTLKPYFLSALTTCVGLAWKSGVAAEAICWPRPGIGTQIYNTKLYLEIPSLFAWTAVVVALSLLLEGILRRLLNPEEGNRH